jgi:tetratricopeptide (TPR) repeat protein
MKRAMDALQSTVGSGHMGSAFLPIELERRSGIELQLGLVNEAVADASEALALFQKQIEPGTYSSTVGHAYLSLGKALKAQGKSDKAGAAFRSAAEQLENTLGPDHPNTRTARTLAGLGPH